MRAKAVFAVALSVCAVALVGCATSNMEGTYGTRLVPGSHTVTERSLRDGVWEWEVTYEHESFRTTGELQVFASEGGGYRLIDKVSIEPASGGTAGDVVSEGAMDIRIALEVFTTDGGDIAVEWGFHRI